MILIDHFFFSIFSTVNSNFKSASLKKMSKYFDLNFQENLCTDVESRNSNLRRVFLYLQRFDKDMF